MSSQSVTIEAPAAEVSALVIDLEGYPSWSSAIKAVEVIERDGAGRASKANVKIEAGVLRDQATLSYDYSKAPSEVSFSLDDADLMTEMSGSYLMKDNGDDTTTVTYSLHVEVSMPVPEMMRKKAEMSTIELALGQLKKKIEG